MATTELTIITNNAPRPILHDWDLTAEERAEFDYIDWPAVERGEASAEFARYKGELYDLNDCEGTFPGDRRWFYRSDSFFSGVLFRYAPHEDPYRAERGDIDPEHIICGRYYA